ncbi:MAG: hypothetical protein R2932_44245 [Caldilineaceae bacterium]
MRPKLLLIDDLQWCDQETLAWLRFLLRFAPDAPLLLLGTVRTEEVEGDHSLHAFTRELQVSKQLTTVELPPLNAAETAALAAQVSKAQLDNAAVNHLVHASEGNPLFVVEMVQSGGWPGAHDRCTRCRWRGQTLPPRSMPSFSTGWRSFPRRAPWPRWRDDWLARSPLIFCVQPVNGGGRGGQWLGRTVAAQKSLRERGANGYDFSHDRIRDVTYTEISPILRPQLHKQVALALEEQFQQELDE